MFSKFHIDDRNAHEIDSSEELGYTLQSVEESSIMWHLGVRPMAPYHAPS